MDKVVPPIVLLMLALFGSANSLCFTLIYYRVVNPDSARLPRFCRLGENTCAAVVFTRYGRLFYVPNSLLGIVFYLLLIDVAISKFVTGKHHLLDYITGGTGFVGRHRHLARALTGSGHEVVLIARGADNRDDSIRHLAGARFAPVGTSAVLPITSRSGWQRKSSEPRGWITPFSSRG